MKSTITTAPAGVSQIFSPARFAAYFRLYLYGSRRKLLLAVGQIFIITFIFMIFCYYMGGKDQYIGMSNVKLTSYDPMWGACHEVRMMFAIIFSAFAGSWMYSSVSSKNTRLTTFEIPSSQLEKFFTWWLIYFPIFVIVMLVCFYVADVLRVVWIMVSSDYGQYAHITPIKNLLTFTVPPYPYDSFNIPEPYQTAFTALAVYGSLITINALFSLGSIFLHKLSFLKTVVFLFVFMIIVSILSTLGYNVFFGDDVYELTSRLSSRELSTLVISWSVVIVLNGYFYWLGYARYKETEIVNRW